MPVPTPAPTPASTPLSIRARLLLLVLCIVLPSVAAALWGIARMHRAEQAALERNLQDTTRALAMVVDRELTKRAAIARVLSHTRLLDRGTDATPQQLIDFEQQARQAMQGLDGWVELRGPEQLLLNTRLPASAARHPTPSTSPLREAPTVEALEPAAAGPQGGVDAASANGEGVNTAAANAGVGILRAALVQPVQRDNRTLLNLSVTILPGELQRIVDGLNLPRGWMATVLDHRQTVVARHPEGDGFAGRPAPAPLRERLTATRDALFETTARDGTPMLGYFSRSGQGWTFITALPQRTLVAGVPDAVLQMLLGGLATLALGILGALWAARRIVEPLVSLKGAAARLQAGEAVDAGPTGLSECDEVAQALGKASDALRGARSDLEHQVAAAIARTREAEQRVSHGQRVEALGRLTGGVAHDFNNLLGVVSNSAHLLQRQQTTPESQLPLAAILRAVDAGSRLTQHLLRFAKRQPVRPQAVALGSTLPDAQELLQTVLGKRVAVSVTVAPGVWPVTVDSSELELALINLALNARDAMPPDGGGHVWVEARNADAQDHADAAWPADGRYVLITFTDDGMGLDDSLAERVFEPFFTTKEVGKGTGLGLSQVHGFCAQAGGAARLNSTPGLGTTVSMLLPASGGAVAVAATAPAAGKPAAAGTAAAARGSTAAVATAPAAASGIDGAQVLLVEDNDELAQVTLALLESYGCRVVRSRNGEDALALASNPSRPFDVVLSDIVMPGALDGLQLAQALRVAMPGLPLVLISGYSRALASAAADVVVLQKPCAPEDVIAALMRAMAAGGGATSKSSAPSTSSPPGIAGG